MQEVRGRAERGSKNGINRNSQDLSVALFLGGNGSIYLSISVSLPIHASRHPAFFPKDLR